jgi:siderophore synthetase component
VNGAPRALGLVELVASLDIEPASQRRLQDELGQTLALCRWNRASLPHQHEPRRRLGFQALESAIVEGHPYHPCFKTRTGFSLRDHEDYGFEAGNEFQLQWLAVVKASLRTALPQNEATFWQRELGESEYAALTRRLEQHGGDWHRYSLVPVHPWQLEALRSASLERAFDAHEILLLGSAGDRYHATQSLRTLVNASHPEKANVKLPLDIVCTSTRRNLEGHFVCTAPALSAWLVSLVASDPFLQARQHLVLLREYAGVVYETEPGCPDGRLGALYRESVCDKLELGEAAVPFTALALVESDGRPFIAEWLAAYDADAWVERLVEVVVVPIWHMLVHHGVAFEAHAQNLILVHRDGWPMKVVLRDFHEETEFVSDYLRAPEQLPAFEQIDPFFASVPDDDGYRMASTDALCELFMDTVYVYNLADLSFLLERFFGFDEATFWRVVRKQLQVYAQLGVTEPSRIDRIASDGPEIAVESLLKKKILDGARLDFFEHRIRNPLHSEPCR